MKVVVAGIGVAGIGVAMVLLTGVGCSNHFDAALCNVEESDGEPELICVFGADLPDDARATLDAEEGRLDRGGFTPGRGVSHATAFFPLSADEVTAPHALRLAVAGDEAEFSWDEAGEVVTCEFGTCAFDGQPAPPDDEGL